MDVAALVKSVEGLAESVGQLTGIEQLAVVGTIAAKTGEIIDQVKSVANASQKHDLDEANKRLDQVLAHAKDTSDRLRGQ